MNYFRSIILATILVVTMSVPAMAQDAMCGKKINSFDFVVDYSGSMMMQNAELKESKINIAKNVLSRINSIIPALDYYGGMHTLAPATSMINQGMWDRTGMSSAIAKLHDNFPIYGRLTPMGTGLKGYEPWISSMHRNAALIMVTDGYNNRGLNLVNVVQEIYASQRDLVVHIISFADTREGKDIIAQIATLNPNTIVADGVKLATNDQMLEQFVIDVWCDQTEEVIVLRGVNFAFDSHALNANAKAILDEAANIIKQHNNKNVAINGWTDIIGTDEYNMGLSERRANSVKNYLADQGIPPSRLMTAGHGESTKYDNKTEEGRYLNRRVELIFE